MRQDIDIEEYIPFAEKACDFLSNSPDPYHCVQNNVNKLRANGYVALSKKKPFAGVLEPGGKYFYTVNKTTLVAFAVGHNYKAGNGFKIIGGHTDSPNLKVKPYSKRSANGCIMLAVECYGGGLWHTWLDRDLGVSGRVLVRDRSSPDGKEMIKQRFVKIDKPVARVSSLCIHLKTAEERKALSLNKETHMVPILGTAGILQKGVKEQLTGADMDDFWKKEQEPMLLCLLAKELKVDVKDIADFELNLFDTQPACLGGLQNEFLYSARLDNQATCFVSVEALVHYTNSNSFENDEDVSMVCLFDHEEVGSVSAHGAGSPIVSEALRRISTALSNNPGILDPDLYSASIRKSFLFSVDQAHAIHPNFPNKHEKSHSPLMNNGVVVKNNQNQRYTTNSVTGFIIREIVRKAGIQPVQEFVVRNDCPCGSTIGPILSSATGIRTVDAGMAQLSMHSIREVMGIVDLTNGFELFDAFFTHFRDVDDCLEG
jgi:aspartyl aminopeptidase